MSKKGFASPSHSSDTPPGTPPQAMRRATKHKRAWFAEHLMQAHAAKQARKAARAEERARFSKFDIVGATALSTPGRMAPLKGR